MEDKEGDRTCSGICAIYCSCPNNDYLYVTMSNLPKYQDRAASWAKEHHYDVVDFVTKDDAGEVYYIFDTSMAGLKTGRPRFILIGNDGHIELSFDWDSHRVMSLYRAYLRLKQS